MELVKYEQARHALQICATVDEAKNILDKSAALAAYAKQANDHEMAIWLAEMQLRAMRKVGELTSKLEKAPSGKAAHSLPMSGKSKAKSIADAGLSKNKVSRCEKISRVPEEKFDAIIEKAKEEQKPVSYADVEATVKLNSGRIVSKFSGDNEWYTPAKYIESARTVMGHIDLDPASNDFAQETVKAKEYYTIDNSGLNKEWLGNIWMNPPYSAKEIKLFIENLLRSEFDQAVVLTNNSADTSWFVKMANACSLMCFTSGRISFYNNDGQSSAPTNGQTFFYFGHETELFTKEFSQYGLILKVVA